MKQILWFKEMETKLKSLSNELETIKSDIPGFYKKQTNFVTEKHKN